ncbi:MAG: two-component system, OmpR family, sensor kinase [Solirubrobacteraceae bacterium]|nr:two-component system, OmpR family, sensor kinase [Solirubrobacteraceae bacterium]
MSLRSRLLIGLAVLVAIGLGVAAIVTYAEQRTFLLHRVDQQADAALGPLAFRLHVRGSLAAATPPARVPKNSLPNTAPATFEPPGTYVELLDAQRRVIQVMPFDYGQTAASPPALPAQFPVAASRTGTVHLFTVNSKAGSSLRYRVGALGVGSGRTLVVAVPLREVEQTLHQLIVVESIVGAGVILALVVLGWIVIRVGLRPLERIGRVADEIAHGDLSRRVSPDNPRTEVGRLGSSLNAMLVQIEQAFADRRESEDRLRRFLSDASHELRTPLSAIRGYAELFRLGAASDPAALARAMSRIESEAARMGVLVEDLLLLARLDEMPEMHLSPVDLRELAEHAAEDTRAVAPTRQVRLSGEGPVMVLADREQLRQVLANLTRNAVIHTPADSPIELSVGRERDTAVLEVRDHGPGLPDEAGDRVFDRFWRNEGGRSRGRGGAGLGLSIVKAVVEAHHGEVHAGNHDEGGAVFRVTLPILEAMPSE